MCEDTARITADNLRADFLNATTTWERWKILNRALDWAVAASETAADLKGRAEFAERTGWAPRLGTDFARYPGGNVRAGTPPNPGYVPPKK